MPPGAAELGRCALDDTGSDPDLCSAGKTKRLVLQTEEAAVNSALKPRATAFFTQGLFRRSCFPGAPFKSHRPLRDRHVRPAQYPWLSPFHSVMNRELIELVLDEKTGACAVARVPTPRL